MTPLILAAALALPLEAIPGTHWTFELPWPSSPESVYWGLEAPSNNGHCVEVCFYIDGHEMGCSPMMREDNGMEVCKEKMARTEGFELAMDLMANEAQRQITALEAEMAAWQKKAKGRKQEKALLILQTQANQIIELLNAFQEASTAVPQEARPEEGE